jgi:hypothetical protein
MGDDLDLLASHVQVCKPVAQRSGDILHGMLVAYIAEPVEFVVFDKVLRTKEIALKTREISSVSRVSFGNDVFARLWIFIPIDPVYENHRLSVIGSVRVIGSDILQLGIAIGIAVSSRSPCPPRRRDTIARLSLQSISGRQEKNRER